MNKEKDYNEEMIPSSIVTGTKVVWPNNVVEWNGEFITKIQSNNKNEAINTTKTGVWEQLSRPHFQPVESNIIGTDEKVKPTRRKFGFATANYKTKTVTEPKAVQDTTDQNIRSQKLTLDLEDEELEIMQEKIREQQYLYDLEEAKKMFSPEYGISSKPAVKKINKSEEVFINYNELADAFAIQELKDKNNGEYDEIKMLDEYLILLEKYKNIILKYERTES